MTKPFVPRQSFLHSTAGCHHCPSRLQSKPPPPADELEHTSTISPRRTHHTSSTSFMCLVRCNFVLTIFMRMCVCLRGKKSVGNDVCPLSFWVETIMFILFYSGRDSPPIRIHTFMHHVTGHLQAMDNVLNALGCCVPVENQEWYM